MQEESTIKIGKEGEDEAVQHLINKEYKILERNWQMRKREVDIICRHKEYLVFVEVKSRTEGFMESPLEAITLKKQKNIIDAADLYIKIHNSDLEIRFDVISIVFNPDRSLKELEHIPSAFYPRITRIK